MYGFKSVTQSHLLLICVLNMRTFPGEGIETGWFQCHEPALHTPWADTYQHSSLQLERLRTVSLPSRGLLVAEAGAPTDV
jgi:hypothetical protein